MTPSKEQAEALAKIVGSNEKSPLIIAGPPATGKTILAIMIAAQRQGLMISICSPTDQTSWTLERFDTIICEVGGASQLVAFMRFVGTLPEKVRNSFIFVTNVPDVVKDINTDGWTVILLSERQNVKASAQG